MISLGKGNFVGVIIQHFYCKTEFIVCRLRGSYLFRIRSHNFERKNSL